MNRREGISVQRVVIFRICFVIGKGNVANLHRAGYLRRNMRAGIQILQVARVRNQRRIAAGIFAVIEQAVRGGAYRGGIYHIIGAFYGKRNVKLGAAGKFMLGLFVEARGFAFQTVKRPHVTVRARSYLLKRGHGFFVRVGAVGKRNFKA